MKKGFFTLFMLVVALAASAQLQVDLALKYLVQAPIEKSTKIPVIILLHGYGSNEQDLYELKNTFPKNYLIVSACAPYPVGAQGYQWFDLHRGDGQAEINNSRELIIKFIEQIITKYKADPRTVYIMGFSQGAMMSYEVGLTNPDKVKGIGVLSGRLFLNLKNQIKNTSSLKQLKIFISHGTIDDRITFSQGKAAYDYLKSISLKPEFHEYAGMGHSINNDVLKDLIKWLK